MARTIDLGLVGTDDVTADGAGPRGRARWRRPLRAPGPRSAWAAGRAPGWWPAAAVAVALALGSSLAPPAAHPSGTLVPVLTAPAGEAAIVGDSLFLHRSTLPPDGSTLTAYRVTDGHRIWHRPVPAVSFTVVAGVPIAIEVSPPIPPGGGAVVAPTVTSTALAPETGAPLWTRPGSPAGEVAGGALYLRPSPTGDEEVLVAAVDPDTGRQVWQVPVRGRLDWDRERLVALSADGVLASYDLTTGARLASRRLSGADGPGAAAPGDPSGGDDAADFLTAVVVGPQVMLMDRRLTGTLSAYDADTLAHLWTTTVPAGDRPRRCDQVICLTSSGHIHALDPLTGEEAWPPVEAGPSSDRVPMELPTDGYVLLGETSLGSSSVVLEVATGRTWELEGWIVSRLSSPPLVQRALRPEGTRPTPPAGPLLFQPDLAAHTTWVGRLDPEAREVAVLGTIDDALPAWCTTATFYLLCNLPDRPGQMRLWRAG